MKYVLVGCGLLGLLGLVDVYEARLSEAAEVRARLSEERCASGNLGLISTPDL